MPPGPQAQHLRRESSQSAHSDMSNTAMNRGFQPNGGRGGRGQFTQGYGPPVNYSPGPAHRQLPNQQRGGPAPFQNQGPLGAHPNSPYRQTRSPAITPAQMSQQSQFANQQVPHGYPGYPQHLQAQQVYKPFPTTSSASSLQPVSSVSNLRDAVSNSKIITSNISPISSSVSTGTVKPPFRLPVEGQTVNSFSSNLSALNGNYENYLTILHNQGMYGMPGFDPNAAAYYNYGQNPYIHPGMGYQGAPPSSPRPSQYPPHAAQPPYIPGQYGAPHAQTMSRTPSQLSERPASTAAQPQTPSMTAASHIASTPSHSSSSPAPSSSTFTIPNRTKSKGIVIKNPDGEVVTFDMKASSPAPPPASGGPVVVSTPTPPPRVPSTAGSHGRTDSISVKTAEEKKLEFQEQVKRQLAAESEDAKKKEEEERRAKEEADAKAAKEKEEAERAARAREEAERAAKERLEAEKAKAAEEQAKKDAAEKKRLEDEEFERMIAEMEAKEKEDEERERQFQEKRKKEQEEAKKREAEAAAKADEEMRRLEREAEEAEEAKAKRAASKDDSKADDEAKKLFASLKKPTLGPGAGAESGASTPTSESMPPPTQGTQPRSATGKPKPAALKLETTKPVEPAQPTAGMQSLKTSRFLAVQGELNIYPAGVKSPNPALNQGKANGRKYDKDFLLQFQEVFKEKPSVDWDSKLKETVGDGSESARPQSARTPSMMGGRQPSRGGISSGLSGPMGAFNGVRTLPPGTTSQERFMASQQGSRGPTMSNPLAQFANRPGGFSMGGAPQMVRTGSYQNMPQPNSPRTGSTRGKGSRRGDGNRAPSKREEEQAAKAMPLTAGQELKPLEVSTGGWKPSSIGKPAAQQATSGHMQPDMVQRKVKSNLNKMTPENFDKISDQILAIAAQSKDEDDGRTLRQVIQLTFEKACDEAHWAAMYAKFCKRMLETMSPEVKDDNIRDKNGNPVVGGALFRKYLLNRCQEDFERGWEANLPEKPEEGAGQEAAMLSDDYYVAAAAKRKGLGLIQFIGELYKLGMLTLRIMHECVLRLLNFEGLPDEAAVESLTKLLRTIGATMQSTDQGPALLETYFARINKIMNMDGLPSRLKFMLMDVVDLKAAGWRSKDDAKGPKTIQEIREEAAAAQQAAEAERQRTKQGGGRPVLGRGDARSGAGLGMAPPPDYNRSQVGMDDLRRLTKGAAGRTTSTGPSQFGPSSMFNAGRSGSGRRGLGPSMNKAGDESGASSRTGTPPVKEKESAHHVNSFR